MENCKADLRRRVGELACKLDVPDPEELADGLILIIEGAMASHHVFGCQGPSAAILATADALINARTGTIAV